MAYNINKDRNTKIDTNIQYSDDREKEFLCNAKKEESGIRKMYEFVAKDGTHIRCKTKERFEQYKKYFKK